MVRLTELGYLKKPHVSAGRIPTPTGMKFYVKQLMKEKDLSVAEEVSLKEKVWDLRERERDFLKEVTKTLADRTKALAVTTTNEGEVFCSGYANILDMPEFFDIDLTKNLLSIVEEAEYFTSLFSQQTDDEEIHILLGEDLGPRLSGPYGFVYTKYRTSKDLTGEIGVLGPSRLSYTNVVPTVRYFGDLIKEISEGW
jgi:heat-inducible transcriptional repressor